MTKYMREIKDQAAVQERGKIITERERERERTGHNFRNREPVLSVKESQS